MTHVLFLSHNSPLSVNKLMSGMLNITVLYRRRPNAALALPSIFRQRQRAASNKSKHPKVVQTWDRDIVCVPARMPMHSWKYQVSPRQVPSTAGKSWADR